MKEILLPDLNEQNAKQENVSFIFNRNKFSKIVRYCKFRVTSTIKEIRKELTEEEKRRKMTEEEKEKRKKKKKENI